MKVVTAEQMAALEQASERTGVSTDTLMENAGLAVAQWARRLLGGAAAKRVLVLVGPGNNGADGLCDRPPHCPLGGACHRLRGGPPARS